MTIRITVADGLVPLADALTGVLAHPHGDPFTPDVVAVPGDGVRRWLVTHLARRLGIVANIEFVFPGTLVRRALGEPVSDATWAVGPLTWAILEVLHERGDELGIRPDAVRARAIADLFDRYALHRSEMVRIWELGRDLDAVGQPLAPNVRWQPVLWRRLVELSGRPSSATEAAQAVGELRRGVREPRLPGRVTLFGLASLPSPHLDVLAALGTRRDVVVLAPASSLVAWQAVHAVVGSAHGPANGSANGLRHSLQRPLRRTDDPTSALVRHPLAAGWGRSTREAHVLLLDAMAGVAEVTTVRSSALQVPGLLGVLQAAIVGDLAPPGPAAAGQLEWRHELAADDRSIEWHRCHGPARQVEVLRDVIVRLLDPARPGPGDIVGPDATGRSLEPRDICILCPDVGGFAPLIEAAFSGDPGRGLPAVPVRIADRSIRLDNPLLDAVASALALIDGRFRAGDVLAFAARPPVRLRFGLLPEHLERISDWVDQVHVSWGLDPSSRASYDVPASVTAHTWQAGLDQLLLGAAMADAGDRLGPADTVPFGDVEGGDVDIVGAMAELVHRLGASHRELTGDHTVAQWCSGVREMANRLCSVPDADSWQWHDLDTELEAMNSEAAHTMLPADVPPRLVASTELAALLLARLNGRPGRVSFGSGAVTVSSLTAQRGVPHRVVCLLGLDGDLGGAGFGSVDDLALATPCVGDRDARSELRAQLLDAVLAAGEQLVICSTARDMRSNAAVPPAVPLAELADLLDASAVAHQHAGLGELGRCVRASDAVAIDHPRHAWSEVNFVRGALGVPGPFGFDASALAAALARRHQDERSPFVTGQLPETDGHTDGRAGADIDLARLIAAITHPVKAVLQQRLGIWLGEDADERDDLIPLASKGLHGWRVRDALFEARCAAGAIDAWESDELDRWEAIQRARGSVPPLAFGADALASANANVSVILRSARSALGDLFSTPPITVPVELQLPGGRRVIGGVTGVRGSVVTDVSASTVRAKHLLAAWVRVVVLACAQPDVRWEAVLIGNGGDTTRLTPRSVVDAEHALVTIVDLAARARRSLVPVTPNTGRALVDKGLTAARGAWAATTGIGEGNDPWVRFACGRLDIDDLLRIPPLPDEAGPDWGSGSWGDGLGRVELWANRLWRAWSDTLHVDVSSGASAG